VSDCILKLKAEGFLLEEDAVNLLQQAARQNYWDK
jgi:hypothetical protein